MIKGGGGLVFYGFYVFQCYIALVSRVVSKTFINAA